MLKNLLMECYSIVEHDSLASQLRCIKAGLFFPFTNFLIPLTTSHCHSSSLLSCNNIQSFTKPSIPLNQYSQASQSAALTASCHSPPLITNFLFLSKQPQLPYTFSFIFKNQQNWKQSHQPTIHSRSWPPPFKH
jgi:hypothetical protein